MNIRKVANSDSNIHQVLEFCSCDCVTLETSTNEQAKAVSFCQRANLQPCWAFSWEISLTSLQVVNIKYSPGSQQQTSFIQLNSASDGRLWNNWATFSLSRSFWRTESSNWNKELQHEQGSFRILPQPECFAVFQLILIIWLMLTLLWCFVFTSESHSPVPWLIVGWEMFSFFYLSASEELVALGSFSMAEMYKIGYFFRNNLFICDSGTVCGWLALVWNHWWHKIYFTLS